jgi:hypothetical protein
MLTKSELQSIFSAVQTTDKGLELLNEVARKAVRKAYSNAEDKGEFARTLFGHVADGLKSQLAHFFRRAGLNVTLDGKKDTLSHIGGVVDANKQAKILAALPDMYAITLDMEDKSKKPKKDPEGTWAEQADAWIKSGIARLKKERPEVAGLVNQRLQKPAPWVAKLTALDPTPEEILAIIGTIKALREGDEVILKAA